LAIDLSDVIASLATGTYTVTRQSVSAYGSDGRLDAPSTTTFSITACVQPVTGRELQRLPEGLQNQEVLAVWSPVELKTQGPGQDPDLVSIDGDSYEVHKLERWNTLGAYWRALLTKT